MRCQKKKVFFLGAIFFFGSIWFMLSQLESPKAKRAFGGMPDSAELDVRKLEDKIVVLEKDLSSNQENIMQIKDRIDDLMQKGNVHNMDHQQIVVKNPVHNFHPLTPYLNDSSVANTCPAVTYSFPHTDLNMVEVYDTLPFADVDGGVWKQGFPIETNDQEWQGRKLKVFVVPHSHNDPGWIKTFEKYFHDQTFNILNTVVDSLSEKPTRRFIWAEISYLSLWWNSASPDRIEKARALINNGQLEIVTGGWVMNDEANTHYFSMIDQMIEGNEWLRRNTGAIPKSSWAIDPFGHSSTMSYILKRSGFKNMLIQRIHYAMKKFLAEKKSFEFRWRQLWDKDSDTDMTCHMMPFYSYDVPHTCGPDPKICCQFDFARLPGFKLNCPWKVPPVAINDANVRDRSLVLLDQYRKKSKLFKSDTLLVILGDDFRYTTAAEAIAQFDNYDRIFEFVNSHPEFNAELKFGTLSEYFDAMKAELGGAGQLPSLSGDFFTYADREDHYWSGYFTSRPYHKMQERVLAAHLRGAEILFSLALSSVQSTGLHDNFSKLFSLLVTSRQSLGLFQHHDGITGTAKDHVVVDYGNKLMKGIMDSKKVMSVSAQILLFKYLSSIDPNINFLTYDEVYSAQQHTPTPNMIEIPSDNSGRLSYLVIYNSLTYERTGVVSVIVSTPDVEVLSSSGERIQSQVNPVWDQAIDIRENQFQLSFVATVPAAGLSVYSIGKSSSSQNTIASIEIFNPGPNSLPHNKQVGSFILSPGEIEMDQEFSIENEHLTAAFSASSGFLQSVITKRDGKKTSVKIDFSRYSSRNLKDKSGAYLFLPSGVAVPHVSATHTPLIRVVKGPVLSRVDVILPNVVHRVSLHAGTGAGVDPLGIHICNFVDVRSNMDNQELAMRINSEVRSGSKFYTDLNGFQIQPRTTYDKIPLQANYYPMPSTAFIQDQNTRLSLLSGQPLGVSSLHDGQLEVILDRRLMQDDNRGLGQGVKDNLFTPESFVLLIERWTSDGLKSEKANTDLSYLSLAANHALLELLHPFRTFHSTMDSNSQFIKDGFKPMRGLLPCDIHMLNLRSVHAQDGALPTGESALLLHRMGRECSLDADRYFSPTCDMTHHDDARDIPIKSFFGMSGVKETSLSLQHDKQSISNESNLSIKPMEIQAYRVTLS